MADLYYEDYVALYINGKRDPKKQYVRRSDPADIISTRQFQKHAHEQPEYEPPVERAQRERTYTYRGNFEVGKKGQANPRVIEYKTIGFRSLEGLAIFVQSNPKDLDGYDDYSILIDFEKNLEGHEYEPDKFGHIYANLTGNMDRRTLIKPDANFWYQVEEDLGNFQMGPRNRYYLRMQR